MFPWHSLHKWERFLPGEPGKCVFLPVALAARIFDVQDQPKNHKRTIQTLSKRKGAESNQIGNVKLLAPYCTCLLSSFVMHFWSPSPQRLFCACVSFGRRAQTHPVLLPKCNGMAKKEVKVCRYDVQFLNYFDTHFERQGVWWCRGDPHRRLFWHVLNIFQ